MRCDAMLIKKFMFYPLNVCQIFTSCDCLRQWTSEWLIRPKLDELNPRLITPLSDNYIHALCPVSFYAQVQELPVNGRHQLLSKVTQQFPVAILMG